MTIKKNLEALTEFIGRGIAPKYTDSEQASIIVLNQKCIRDFSVNYEQARRHDLRLRKVSNERIVKPFDVLINSTGVGTLGRVAQYLDPDNRTTIDSHVTIARPDNEKVDPLYFGYLLKSKQAEIENLAEGTTGQTELSRDAVKSLIVEIVNNRSIQHSVGLALKSIDDKIALNRKLNETLEGMARALFQSWFVDFDPVKAKLAALRHGRDAEKACIAALSGKLRIRPGKPKPETLDDQLPTAEELDAAIAELDSLAAAQLESLSQTASHFPSDFQHSELGLIPQGWKIGTLNDFSTLNSSSWTTRRHPEVVHYIDLANCKNGYVLAANEFNWRDAPSRARRILKRGDTIIGTVRPGNRSFALIGDSQVQLTGSTGFAVLTPLKPYFREFIYLHSCGDENIARLTHLADGGAYPAVRPDVVSAYEVICPPEGLLCVFSSRISDCFDQINLNEHQSRTLAELRDTLLPKLLSGELKV